MNTHDERGVALVLALFLMSIMTVIGASLMFLSQTETYASMNYRVMSQARYAAEAGIHKASNFLLDSSQYVPPGSAGDPLSNYDRTVSPVTYNGQPVVLSATSAQASNYPVAAVRDAFNAAFHTGANGSLTAGRDTLTYTAHATLIAMQTFESYGGVSAVAQTWQITGTGGLSNSPKATVEVVAIVETPKVSAHSYAAFATADICGAIYFHGNTTVDSYDSSQGPPSGPGNSTARNNGNVGTNGNLHIKGSVDVQGNLYTPRTGVGTCTAGAVDALSITGNAVVEGSVVQLPAPVSYPPPTFATMPPTTAVTIDATLLANASSACTSLGLTSGTNCTVNAAAKTVTVDGHGSDVSMPSVTVAGGFKLVFVGHSTPTNTVNINSLLGGGDVEVQANMTGDLNEAVLLKVAGKNSDGTDMATPFDLSTMTWKQNSSGHSYDASALQIAYGGPGIINMKGGNSQSAATIYAPNAVFELQGTQDLYGSILAKTIENHGDASIHYDRRLKRDFYVAGHAMEASFSWKRF